MLGPKNQGASFILSLEFRPGSRQQHPCFFRLPPGSTRNCLLGWEQSKQGQRSEGFVLRRQSQPALLTRHSNTCVTFYSLTRNKAVLSSFDEELHKSMAHTPSDRENRTRWNRRAGLPGCEAWARVNGYFFSRSQIYVSREPKA